MATIEWPWQYNFPPFFTYINEGNLHIVLQVLGTNYVLRLIKEDENPVNLQSIQNSIDFVNLVIHPLLSVSDTYQELIEIPLEELHKLSQDLCELRPEKRRHKSKLSQYAIKASNLAILSPEYKDNYCIEIKPKEGFQASSLKSTGKCYYCLKQFLKLEENLINSKSQYCPVNLFSGEQNRMKIALNSLVENPQNNFKIFKDGEIIFDEKWTVKDLKVILNGIPAFRQSTDIFFEFITEVLLTKKNTMSILKHSDQNSSYPTDNKQCSFSQILDTDSFLHKLFVLQYLAEEIHFNYDKVSLDDDSVHIQEMINLSRCTNKEQLLSKFSPVQLALISATARDCSIMIAFTPKHEVNFPYIQIGDHKVSYKVSVTDLEPKGLKSLIKRGKTEKKLLEIMTLGERENTASCNIQPHTETRAKQLEAWQQLIGEYLKANKLSTIDVREAQNCPLFNNAAINRKLSQEAIQTILEDMARSGRAAPTDKSKTVWEVYWHSLDEWGNLVYSWACNNGMNNAVCTLFELREGDTTVDEEFHGLDMNVLVKALKKLETKGKCELMEFDDSQGVKFF